MTETPEAKATVEVAAVSTPFANEEGEAVPAERKATEAAPFVF
ncbi:hypothetical protein [Alteribacter populi]|nr:hypothetical protein [Alteribacter populi]